MTPSYSLSADQAKERIGELIRIFDPRPHWTGRKRARHWQDGLLFLVESERAGMLRVRKEPTQIVPFETPSQDWYQALADDWKALLQPAMQRRGTMRDHTWSAFQHLKRQHGNDQAVASQLEPFFGGLPYGWLHRQSSTFVTACAFDPGRALAFMLEREVMNLGIIGPNWVKDDLRPGKIKVDYESPFTMNWLETSAEFLRSLRSTPPALHRQK